MLRHLLLVTMFAASYGTAHAAPSADTNTSLCEPSEIDLFSCDLPPKVVSICGQQHDRAIYRYGRPGRVELEITKLQRASTGFSGGGEEQVYADTQTNRYVVYVRTTRTTLHDGGRYNPHETSGLLVQRGDRTIFSRQCSQPVLFDPLVQKLIPEGEYVDH